MREIGSDFWLEEAKPHCHNSIYNYLTSMGQDQVFAASGGGATDYAMQNIDVENKTVYMPNYCCQPMIQPFIDNGYSIVYYNVNLENGTYDIDGNFNCGVFFAFSYFGFSSTCMDDTIRKMSNNGAVIIEDITHRMMSDQAYCPDSDFLVASLRKWFPIVNGGIAINVKGKFKHPYQSYRDAVQEELCAKAMALKAEYINGKTDDKAEYLDLYRKSNDAYIQFKNKAIADSSIEVMKQIDVDKIKRSRRENAQVIFQMLENQPGILLPLRQVEGDTPIFVPAILNNRDAVRKALIDRSIYLPAHWPVEEQPYNPAYDTELSLVCDQRYSKQDIENYVNILIEILGQA